MNKLKQFLNRPYSMEIRPSYTILIVTAIVLFVLGILQPFGINEAKSANFIGILAFSGIGTIIGLIISIYILPHIFRSFYSPESWTIGKTILHYL
ncbi:LytTR family transcriptional regulator, partial [Parabacteroides sp. OttesenSCG-928-G07]|nr:LytTR family transcriptional regulator [Parabacteroides sp. OttesenSCG-928-G07]